MCERSCVVSGAYVLKLQSASTIPCTAVFSQLAWPTTHRNALEGSRCQRIHVSFSKKIRSFPRLYFPVCHIPTAIHDHQLDVIKSALTIRRVLLRWNVIPSAGPSYATVHHPPFSCSHSFPPFPIFASTSLHLPCHSAASVYPLPVYHPPDFTPHVHPYVVLSSRMLNVIPWRPLQAVLWDALQNILQALHAISAGPKPLPCDGVPVYVMLPLDVALPTPQIPPDILHSYLKRLASVGVHGVLVDVWWRICEPLPGQYDFSPYIALAKTCRSLGLKIQAVMSFHACGGNPGDSVSIPLPDWVLEAGQRHQFWFTDRSGNQNTEYISFGADYEPVLPPAAGVNDDDEGVANGVGHVDENVDGEGNGDGDVVTENVHHGWGGNPLRPRTPLQAYANFTQAFVTAMQEEGLLGETVSELQIGLGPCGELRYPSYPMSRWKFPGIGEFQCYDRYLLRELQATIREKGSEGVKGGRLPPEGTGKYNDAPYDTAFFEEGMHTAAGSFFLQWYSDKLLEHGEDVLRQVRSVIPGEGDGGGGVRVALKVSGVHWWRLSASRAAEATCGYIGAGGKAVYEDIAKIAKAKGASVNLTCLEMRTIDTPLRARCGPRQLVGEVFECARKVGVAVAGENALQNFEERAFGQVVQSFRGCAARKEGFTLLRLCEDLMREEKLRHLQAFVREMKTIDARAEGQ